MTRMAVIIFFVFLIFVLPVFGSQGRGGGSYVVINGQVIVSDPYYAGTPASQIRKITAVKYQELPVEVRSYMEQTLHFIDSLLPESTEIDNLIGKILSQQNKYYLVPLERENNVPCEHYLPYLSHPVDSQFQYGCTFGGDTYLFMDKWQRAPVGEQVLALLHERLWALNPNADQADIAAFITSTQVLERLYEKQVNSEDRTPLTQEERSNVLKFYNASVKLNLTLSKYTRYFASSDFKILPGGGVIVPNNSTSVLIDKSSFIGVGAVIVGSGTTINIQNSIVLDSYVYGKTLISNSLIIGSTLASVQLSETLVEKSRLLYVPAWNSKFKEAEIGLSEETPGWIRHGEITSISNIYFWQKASDQHFEINGTFTSPVRITSNTRFMHQNLTVEEGASIEGLSTNFGNSGFNSYHLKVGKYASVKNTHFYINSATDPSLLTLMIFGQRRINEVNINIEENVILKDVQLELDVSRCQQFSGHLDAKFKIDTFLPVNLSTKNRNIDLEPSCEAAGK